MPRTKSILVVEDEDLVRKFIHYTLSTVGYGEILEAENAVQALEILRAHPTPIHLLISDVVMPGELDGRGLATRISDTRPEIRILLMSGYDDDTDELPEGWRFIHKPFRSGALVETVQNLLGV
jgi:YesN/AraC family two-component response regulator